MNCFVVGSNIYDDKLQNPQKIQNSQLPINFVSTLLKLSYAEFYANLFDKTYHADTDDITFNLDSSFLYSHKTFSFTWLLYFITNHTLCKGK